MFESAYNVYASLVFIGVRRPACPHPGDGEALPCAILWTRRNLYLTVVLNNCLPG